MKSYIPLECRKLYYNAYILPVMDYCDTIWGNCTKYNINRIVKLQKRAARIILNMSFDSPSDPLFKKLKWLTFPQRITYHKAIQVYKSLNNLSPSDDLICLHYSIATKRNIIFYPFQMVINYHQSRNV